MIIYYYYLLFFPLGYEAFAYSSAQTRHLSTNPWGLWKQAYAWDLTSAIATESFP